MEEGVETGEALARLLIALLGGSLIGLERERARAGSTARKPDIPGLRSFGLIGLYGGVTGLAADGLRIGGGSEVLPALAFGGFLILYASYTIARYVVHGSQGFTTNAVMLVTFMMGVMAGTGYLIEAAGLSVMVTLLLALKEPVEKLIPAITYGEFLALLEVGVLAVVLAPLIRAYSRPVMGIDPYKVYLFFIIVLAVSFASYAAARALGVKGLVYSALLGSLVSSEAAMSGVTRIAAHIEPASERRKVLRVATAIIVGVLQARGIAISIVALYIFGGPESVNGYIYLMAVAFAASASIVWIAVKAAPAGSHVITAQSPLSWGSAIKAAVAYLAITVAVRLATIAGLAEATPLIALLGGFVNATAAILSVASLVGDIGAHTAVASLFAAVAAASASKPVYADPRAVGPAFRDIVVLSLLLAIIPASMAVAVYANA